jgi:hypothetical protein
VPPFFFEEKQKKSLLVSVSAARLKAKAEGLALEYGRQSRTS